jgi:hypothetical protein
MTDMFLATTSPYAGEVKHGNYSAKSTQDQLSGCKLGTPYHVPSLCQGNRPFSIKDFGTLGSPHITAEFPRPSPANLSNYAQGNDYRESTFTRFHHEIHDEQSQQGDSTLPGASLSQLHDPAKDDILSCNKNISLSPPDRQVPQGLFNNPGSNMRPSRYSGIDEHFNINQEFSIVPQEDVSDACLAKRKLSRGKADKICKRRYGANDPENIMIVNLRETEGLSFDAIAKKLNAKRIDEGRNPTLSTTSVTSRYSRTAPLLFAAQGEVFVLLSKRGSRGKNPRREPFHMAWTDELDLILVQCVKRIEKKKWGEVALLFEQHTGKAIPFGAAALRHSLL